VATAVRVGQRQPSGRGQVPGKVGGIRRAVPTGGRGRAARSAAETPDLTLRALTMELATLGVLVARDTVWHFVRKAGQTVKQRP
jgi:hypothetical protein